MANHVSAATADVAGPQVRSAAAFPKRTPILFAVLFGLGLFFANQCGLFSAWLHAPAGYVPLWIGRANGTAAQIVWFEAFRNNILLPNFQGPWITEPGFVAPLKLLVGRLAEWFNVRVQFSYLTMTAAAYIFAAFSFFRALQIFTDSRKQAVCAFLLAICAVPLASMKAAFVIGQVPLHKIPGLPFFYFNSGDGFFHGANGSLSSTFGTGIVMLAFGNIARYLDTAERRWLWYGAVCAFFSGLFHPFEVFVITGGGSVAFLIYRGRNWSQSIREAAILCGGGALGILVYVWQALSFEWLKEQASITKYEPGSLYLVLKTLGLPLALAILLAILQPRAGSARTLLLRCWIGAALAGIYIPVFTWTQHFLDGVLYAGALLLVREISRFRPFHNLRAAFPRLVPAALAIWCIAAIVPHVSYRLLAYMDGRRPDPLYMHSGLQPAEERELTLWLHHAAPPETLVFAPPDNAAWLAAAPMHSFASHQHLSLTYPIQLELAEKFYAGRMTSDAARQMLSEYGARFVVIPTGSHAMSYVGNAPMRARYGSLQVFEFPEHKMRPFKGLKAEEERGLALLKNCCDSNVKH